MFFAKQKLPKNGIKTNIKFVYICEIPIFNFWEYFNKSKS